MELQTLRESNARLTAALQESAASVEQWKRQFSLCREENDRLRNKVGAGTAAVVAGCFVKFRTGRGGGGGIARRPVFTWLSLPRWPPARPAWMDPQSRPPVPPPAFGTGGAEPCLVLSFSFRRRKCCRPGLQAKCRLRVPSRGLAEWPARGIGGPLLLFPSRELVSVCV